MASKNIKSAEDQPHILPSGQGNRPPRVQDPIPQGESLAAEARDTNTPKKRRKIAPETPDSDSDQGIQEKGKSQEGVPPPRYLVVESDNPEKPFNRLHIFAVGRWFDRVATGLSKRIKEMRGGFEVDCQNQREARLLLKRHGSEFMGIKIKVSEHRSKNSSKGAIWCRNLEGLTEDEILGELKAQGVTRVERCMKGEVGAKVPTHTLFLTFSKPELPKEINIGYLKVKVSLYVREPLQCYKCFKFGHPSHKCRATRAVCGKCGYDAHEGSCPHPPKCSNCKGDHSPKSKKCPTYVYNKSIKTLMTENKSSFQEAKKLVDASAPKLTKSFAQAATSSAKQVSQTITSSQEPLPKLSTRSRGVQFREEELPEEIRAEALALARQLRDFFKKSKKDAASQFNKTNDRRAKQAPKASSSSAPKPIGAKNQKKPAPSTPKTKTGGTPAPAHQAAGEAVQAAQSAQPLPPSSKSSQEEVSASAHQAAETGQNDPTSSESEMEETSASAPQAAEGGVEIISAEEGETTISGSVSNTPFLDFEQENDNDQPFTSPPRKKKWRKKAEKDPIKQSLNRCPFEDPEGNGVSNWG